MKKLKSALYWLWVLASHIVVFTFFGIIVALTLNLPNTMLSGMIALWLIACGLLFAASDETRDAIKKIIRKDENEH